jgi:hypothetical protein
MWEQENMNHSQERKWSIETDLEIVITLQSSDRKFKITTIKMLKDRIEK